MTESELALAEQKCNDYTVIINRLKHELSESSTVHQSDIRREREVITDFLIVTKQNKTLRISVYFLIKSRPFPSLFSNTSYVFLAVSSIF
jgi:hypothetical protein